MLAPHICHDNALIRGDRDAAVCALRTHAVRTARRRGRGERRSEKVRKVRTGESVGRVSASSVLQIALPGRLCQRAAAASKEAPSLPVLRLPPSPPCPRRTTPRPGSAVWCRRTKSRTYESRELWAITAGPSRLARRGCGRRRGSPLPAPAVRAASRRAPSPPGPPRSRRAERRSSARRRAPTCPRSRSSRRPPTPAARPA